MNGNDMTTSSGETDGIGYGGQVRAAISGTAPVGASDWMEATVGISLPVSDTVRMAGSVTAGLFGEGRDTLLGRVGVSAAF